METFKLMSFMIIIGAIIAGSTNYLAIRMLFRPHHPVKIGKWQLPFTPGLIPKRQDEIAHQLGTIVVDHLLTANGLTKKIKSHQSVQQLTSWLQKEIRDILYSEKNIEQLIQPYFNERNVRSFLTDKTNDYLSKQYDVLLDRYREKTLEQSLPSSLVKKIEANIPSIAHYVVERGQAFLESDEGKQRLSTMIDRFFEQKGKLGNMVSMFISQDRLTDLAQKELGKLLQDESFKEQVTTVFSHEWKRLKEKKLSSFETYISKEEVMTSISRVINNELSLFERIDQPLKDWAPQYEKKVIESFLPKVVEAIIEIATKQMDTLLRELRLQEVVTEQVKSFSTERLEEIVISIAKRELTMITYFGALLGGIIGFIQSLIVIYLG